MKAYLPHEILNADLIKIWHKLVPIFFKVKDPDKASIDYLWEHGGPDNVWCTVYINLNKPLGWVTEDEIKAAIADRLGEPKLQDLFELKR